MRLFGRRREEQPAPGLPADGRARVAGVELSGRRVRADLSGEGPEVLWRTEGEPPRVFEAWRTLAAAHPRTGLWPLLIVDERLDVGFFDPQWPAKVADLGAVLPGRWTQFGAHDEELREQLGPFPGLSAAGSPRDDDAVADAFDMLTGVDSLALVEVERPSDVLSAIGWMGAVNSFEPVELTSYLRSWADRFDAVPVALGFDTLHLAVHRAPAEPEKAAAEAYMFCPDIVDQGIGSVQELAATMIPGPYWYFWWD